MLPLDTLPQELLTRLAEKNVTEDQLSVALRLDLDSHGNFGESWLVLAKEAKTLYRLSPTDSDIHTYDLATLTEPYIDNFTTSNRILGHQYPQGYRPLPRKQEFGDDENAFKAALAVNLLAGLAVERVEHGVGAAHSNGDVASAKVAEHVKGVGGGVLNGGIAANGGNGLNVYLVAGKGQHNGEYIVMTGIAVDDYGYFAHFLSPFFLTSSIS